MKDPIQGKTRTASTPQTGIDCFAPALPLEGAAVELGAIVLTALLTVVVVMLVDSIGNGEWFSDMVAIPLGSTVPGVADRDKVEVHSITYWPCMFIAVTLPVTSE